MTAKTQLIGGKFGFEKVDVYDKPGCLSDMFSKHHVALINARSALSFLVRSLKTKRVWLPSYFCPTILDGLDTKKVSINFYEVNAELDCSDRSWIKNVKNKDLCIFIDYFGFPFAPGCMLEAKSRGGYILRDACQALFTQTGESPADFIIYSPRKFLGIPDGGILVANSGYEFNVEHLSPPPGKWLTSSVEGLMQRRIFDEVHNGERTWYPLLKKLEDEIPVGDYEISQVSLNILKNLTGCDVISKNRRENFLTLLEHLSDIAVFRNLGPGIVPLGFPVQVKNRDFVLKALFEKNIYPAIHWDMGDLVPDTFTASTQLSREIFTIPCDQRYGNAEMEFIVTEMRKIRSRIEVCA